MRLAMTLAALILFAGPVDARGGGRYRSVDGSMVHGPTRGNQDYGPVTAQCRDGTRSFSHHHRGTCSHHGGVAGWVR